MKNLPVLEFKRVVVNNRPVTLEKPVRGVFLGVGKMFIWEGIDKVEVNIAFLKSHNTVHTVLLSKSSQADLAPVSPLQRYYKYLFEQNDQDV